MVEVKSERSSANDPFHHHCVSKIDLPAGAIILEDEFPIFHFPGSTDLNNGDGRNLCLTCGIKFTEQNDSSGSCNISNRCRKCKWPICGMNCEEASVHKNFECKYFIKNDIAYSQAKQLGSSFILNFIILIRAVVACVRDCPGAVSWNKLLSITPPDEDPISIERHGISRHNRSASEFGTNFFSQALEFISDASFLTQLDKNKDVYNHIVRCTMQAYGINTYLTDVCSPYPPKAAAYIYEKASFITHSCKPNCTWTIGNFPYFKIRIRTAISVKQGETLTVSRLENVSNYVAGTRQRQDMIFNGFGFSCKCSICLDATESSSFISALICESCPTQDGYVLPEDPLDVSSKWMCMKCQEFRNDLNILEEVYMCYEELRNFLICLFSVNQSEFILQKCLDILEKFETKIHIDHFLNQLANFTIRNINLKKLSQQFDKTTAKSVIQSGNHLLAITNKIRPGLFYTTVYLMYTNNLALGPLISRWYASCDTDPHIRNAAQICKYEELLQNQRFVLKYLDGLYPNRNNLNPSVVHLFSQVDSTQRSMQRFQTRHFEK